MAFDVVIATIRQPGGDETIALGLATEAEARKACEEAVLRGAWSLSPTTGRFYCTNNINSATYTEV